MKRRQANAPARTKTSRPSTAQPIPSISERNWEFASKMPKLKKFIVELLENAVIAAALPTVGRNYCEISLSIARKERQGLLLQKNSLFIGCDCGTFTSCRKLMPRQEILFIKEVSR